MIIMVIAASRVTVTVTVTVPLTPGPRARLQCDHHDAQGPPRPTGARRPGLGPGPGFIDSESLPRRGHRDESDSEAGTSSCRVPGRGRRPRLRPRPLLARPRRRTGTVTDRDSNGATAATDSESAEPASHGEQPECLRPRPGRAAAAPT